MGQAAGVGQRLHGTGAHIQQSAVKGLAADFRCGLSPVQQGYRGTAPPPLILPHPEGAETAARVGAMQGSLAYGLALDAVLFDQREHQLRRIAQDGE